MVATGTPPARIRRALQMFSRRQRRMPEKPAEGIRDVKVSNHALDWTPADKRAVDLIRVLAMDAVQKVGNGHPGTAMSLAPAAYLLFQRVMRHDPADPHWPGRDRFVLSCGHSSLTLYIQLYLSGYGLTMDDLKALRTWGSLTPGHPEYGLTAGVETTTGPLGQGIGNAVGMAMAARRERGLFAGRPPGARQPHRPLRRQLHIDRGRHQHRQVRGRGRALRGLRLARPEGGLAHARGLSRGRARAVPGAPERQ